MFVISKLPNLSAFFKHQEEDSESTPYSLPLLFIIVLIRNIKNLGNTRGKNKSHKEFYVNN